MVDSYYLKDGMITWTIDFLRQAQDLEFAAFAYFFYVLHDMKISAAFEDVLVWKNGRNWNFYVKYHSS